MDSRQRSQQGQSLRRGSRSSSRKAAGTRSTSGDKSSTPAVNRASTVDEYLRTVPRDRRLALEKLRSRIRSIVPDAEECISYRIPAFRLHGEVIAGFCATAKGCSYFPFSGSTLKTLAPDLAHYEQTKSSLHFATDKPLPAALVRKLLKARIDET